MADLTVTVTESIILNNAKRGSTNTLTVSDITDTFESLENCKYIRVTNLSAAGVMDIAIVTENTNYQVVMTGGTSHILCQADTTAIAEADTTPNFPTLEDITSIQVRPRASENCDVEIFVASL